MSYPTELYDELRAAGCQLDNHESDLYVRASPEAFEIVRRSRRPNSTFRDREGTLWIDVPFAWAPFWRRIQERAERAP